MTTKGKFSGSRGLAWMRNSSLQLSRSLERIGVGDIVDKYTAVGSTIKCYSKTLESFLTSCVPNLAEKKREYVQQIIRSWSVQMHMTCAHMLSDMHSTYMATWRCSHKGHSCVSWKICKHTPPQSHGISTMSIWDKRRA